MKTGDSRPSQLPLTEQDCPEEVGPATVKTWCLQINTYFKAIILKLKLPPDVCRTILIEKFKSNYPMFRQEHIDGIHIVTRGGLVPLDWANRWIKEDFTDSTPLVDAIQEILESDINQ